MQVNIPQLDMYVERKLITKRQHPQLPLYIFNYTPQCQYSKAWDSVTTMCRGLITDLQGNVVAKPFSKFFNYGEQPNTQWPEIDEISEKLDGSLGILYPTKNGWAIASRGSFTSEQAVHGTEVLQEYLQKPGVAPQPGVTYLFEIIYPANRIVVEYGETDDLILLARLAVNGQEVTGKDAFAAQFIKPRKYIGSTLQDIINAPPLTNAEGYVVRFNDGTRIKFKFAEYVRLHRIVTETSSKTIWEALSKGEDISSIIENVPDEFYDWVSKTVGQLKKQHLQIATQASQVLKEVKGLPRKAAAEQMQGQVPVVRAVVFAMLDGKSYDQIIWKSIKPDYQRPFANDEAAA